MLIDATDAQVRTPEVMAVLHDLEDKLALIPQDRVAALAPSSLAKMQMQRAYRSSQRKAFVSRDATACLFARL